MNLLIGADPELFVKQDGRFISAHGMVEGTKDNPFKVEGGAVQVDGMALEFNIDPAASEAEFLGNIKIVMSKLAGMIGDADMVVEPTAHFGSEYISEQPVEARELGCSPDFNAYTGRQNPLPDAEVPFRTAAGHIHIGWTDGADVFSAGHMLTCAKLTKALDISLGVPSLAWDKDQERRGLYGRAGAFRPKSYGCEYRVLSNAWLKSEELMSFVYKRVVNTFNRLVATGELPTYGWVDELTVEGVINNGELLPKLIGDMNDGVLL